MLGSRLPRLTRPSLNAEDEDLCSPPCSACLLLRPLPLLPRARGCIEDEEVRPCQAKEAQDWDGGPDKDGAAGFRLLARRRGPWEGSP